MYAYLTVGKHLHGVFSPYETEADARRIFLGGSFGGHTDVKFEHGIMFELAKLTKKFISE